MLSSARRVAGSSVGSKVGGIPRLRWLTALRAGLLAHSACALVVGILVGSYWAGQREFPGHHHPAGIPDHHHSLSQVVGARALPAPTKLVGREELSEFLEPSLWPVWTSPVRTQTRWLARGPPAGGDASRRRAAGASSRQAFQRTADVPAPLVTS